MSENRFDGADDFVERKESKEPPAETPSYGIKLITSGRLDKKNFPCKPVNLHLDCRLDEWLETHAAGNRQLMMNYLIAKGIEKVIEGDDTTVINDMYYFLED
ncbi:MAG: hypothetical protein GY861_26215 [bacterium]|nr:hypothetical protein [bacterium]